MYNLLILCILISNNLGDLASAKALLYQCIEKEESNPEGRIVLAQLHLKENNLYAASHCLEVALSFNFEVISFTPYFIALKLLCNILILIY